MPIYEFCCKGCGSRFEELIRTSDDDMAYMKCPECNSKKVERLLSGFSFKSSGGSGPAAAGKANGGCGSCSKTACSSCG